MFQEVHVVGPCYRCCLHYVVKREKKIWRSARSIWRICWRCVSTPGAISGTVLTGRAHIAFVSIARSLPRRRSYCAKQKRQKQRLKRTLVGGHRILACHQRTRLVGKCVAHTAQAFCGIVLQNSETVQMRAMYNSYHTGP